MTSAQKTHLPLNFLEEADLAMGLVDGTNGEVPSFSLLQNDLGIKFQDFCCLGICPRAKGCRILTTHGDVIVGERMTIFQYGHPPLENGMKRRLRRLRRKLLEGREDYPTIRGSVCLVGGLQEFPPNVFKALRMLMLQNGAEKVSFFVL